MEAARYLVPRVVTVDAAAALGGKQVNVLWRTVTSGTLALFVVNGGADCVRGELGSDL